MPATPSAISDIQSQYLGEIEGAYALIENNFDQAYARCTDDRQKTLLRGTHAAARDAYFRAVASMLGDNSQFVREIFEELAATNEQLRELTIQLQNIKAFLDLAKQAVRLAASLVTLGSVN